jgi:hypothetical protein
MGHIRLGVLPRYPRWKNVISMIEHDNGSPAEVATRTLAASADILSDPTSQETVGHCIWLLSYLALSAKHPDFRSRLSRIGIAVEPGSTATEFLASTFHVAASDPSLRRPSTAIASISDAAFRESLTRTVGMESHTIFGSGLDEVQRALRKYSTPTRFANLLHIYFASFVARTLRFVIDKEITNHLGAGRRFDYSGAMRDFQLAVDAFAGQTTRIVDSFSSGWYSKMSWQHGEITKSDAKQFSHVALTKLISDIDVSNASL